MTQGRETSEPPAVSSAHRTADRFVCAAPHRTTETYAARMEPTARYTKRAWWLPLLIPATISVFIVLSSFDTRTHVVHRNPFGVIAVWLMTLLTIGAPCFFAGIRFIQQAQSNPN